MPIPAALLPRHSQRFRIARMAITRVVLIGPAHYVAIRGIAAPTVDAFDTPLGRVPMDVEALSKIADLQFVIRADAPHAPEHALEVELPFLQTVLGSFQVVPLLIGDTTPQDVAHVLRQLWGGAETLIVVSSDLSHYHSYETARRLDLATAAAIEVGDWASLGPTQACGCLAVAGLLLEAGRRGFNNREFRQIRPLCTILKADTRANSKASNEIPYTTEQGIISAEQGILIQEQGIFPVKQRLHDRAPRRIYI
jgi:AmmeMemoRadiSam system protein B